MQCGSRNLSSRSRAGHISCGLPAKLATGQFRKFIVNDTQTPRSAIVTGSASGLGRAIAVRLAQEGYRIALADVNDDANRETLELVEDRGGQGRVEHLDVSDPEGWHELIARLRNDWPQLDLLVNNAGVTTSGEVGEHSLDNWHWIMRINLFGAIYGCHHCVPWMKENPRGAHIVNIASVAAVMSRRDGGLQRYESRRGGAHRNTLR